MLSDIKISPSETKPAVSDCTSDKIVTKRRRRKSATAQTMTTKTYIPEWRIRYKLHSDQLLIVSKRLTNQCLRDKYANE